MRKMFGAGVGAGPGARTGAGASARAEIFDKLRPKSEQVLHKNGPAPQNCDMQERKVVK
jgi:hypothetical protein